MTQIPTTTRRSFLGASALLAAGALILPATASAATPIALAMPPVGSDADLRAQIAAILDRPDLTWYGTDKARCSCARCQAIRRAGLICPACGFDGEPIVDACECRAIRASNIKHCGNAIARGVGPDEREPPWYYERLLAESLAMPDRMCKAHRHQSVRELQAHHCAHGMASCPMCGADFDSGEVPMDASQLAARLRDVRALLAVA